MSIRSRYRAWRHRGEREGLEAALADALGGDDAARAVPAARRLVALAEDAFGAEHDEVSVARFALGAALLAAGDAEGARREGEAVLARLPAAGAPSRLDVLQLLASAALAGGEASAVTSALVALAAAIEATPHGEARDLRLADVDTRLGLHLARTGAVDEAWSRLSRALVLRRGRLGPRHLAVGEALHNLATHRIATSSVDEAAARFEEAAEIGAEAGESGAALRESALHNLGVLLEELGRDDEAAAAWERALASRQARLGVGHPSLRATLVRLAQLRDRTGSPLVAAALFARAHDLARAELGDAHPITEALADWKRSATEGA